MQKGDILKKMQIQSLKRVEHKLDISLKNVGDMALKRRARNIIMGLELKSGNKVLEVGCGNGYYLSLLNRIGIKLSLTGIDIDELALKDAKKFINDKKVKVMMASASKIPFPNDTFDKIVMSEVIEHVTDDEVKVLKEVNRVLRKDGILVLTTSSIDYPFFWDPVNWILQHFFNTHIKSGFWAGIWNQHDRLYKESRIERLVKDAGFNVQQIEPLTSWCIPFNHYIVNLIAKLFYSNKLPKNLSKGINKFQNSKQPFLVSVGFDLINLIDKLNDSLPQKNGVSIFIRAGK